MITAAKEELTLTAGEDNLGMYQWNTKTARHYFCKTCGIYTHHWRRSAPEFGVNSGCIENIDHNELANSPTNDGKSMTIVHSKD